MKLEAHDQTLNLIMPSRKYTGDEIIEYVHIYVLIDYRSIFNGLIITEKEFTWSKRNSYNKLIV